MRLNSLYKFYQQHFGYEAATGRQRIAFGRAVADCMDVLKRVYTSQDLSEVSRYGESLHARQLTTQFLENLQILALRRFSNPLGSLTYCEHEIVVDAGRLVVTRRRGLQIASPFLWNHGESELIFLTFSAPNNVAGELGVFVTLAENLSNTRMPVTQVQRYTYWDARNGLESSVARSAVMPAPEEAVIGTCNWILRGQSVI